MMPGRFNNYLIAGNVCNAFAIGELGSEEDFFLMGAEPPDESTYPLLTGNILDSEGNVLFRLVRNVLVINPGNCSRILGDHIGYEIHDSAGVPIFEVRTVFTKVKGIEEECFVTTIKAQFHNKRGEVVFHANSGEPDERIVSGTKAAFGFGAPGGFGVVQGMSKSDLELARIALSSGARIHQPIRGHLEHQEFDLDGKALLGAKLTNCTINVRTGDFFLAGPELAHCQIRFFKPASNVRNLVLMLEGQPTDPSAMLENAKSLIAKRRAEEARRWLEQLLQQHADSDAAKEAADLMRDLDESAP
jgi:hypothetical protein